MGWVTIALGPLQTFFIQLKVISMHQNGRDTHLRQLKILGPHTDPIVMGNLPLSCFKNEMLYHSQIR